MGRTLGLTEKPTRCSSEGCEFSWFPLQSCGRRSCRFDLVSDGEGKESLGVGVDGISEPRSIRSCVYRRHGFRKRKDILDADADADRKRRGKRTHARKRRERRRWWLWWSIRYMPVLLPTLPNLERSLEPQKSRPMSAKTQDLQLTNPAAALVALSSQSSCCDPGDLSRASENFGERLAIKCGDRRSFRPSQSTNRRTGTRRWRCTWSRRR